MLGGFLPILQRIRNELINSQCIMRQYIQRYNKNI